MTTMKVLHCVFAMFAISVYFLQKRIISIFKSFSFCFEQFTVISRSAYFEETQKALKHKIFLSPLNHIFVYSMMANRGWGRIVKSDFEMGLQHWRHALCIFLLFRVIKGVTNAFVLFRIIKTVLNSFIATRIS